MPRTVLVVHSAGLVGKRAAMERVCDELRAQGFEVLEIEARREEAVLDACRAAVLRTSGPAPSPVSVTREGGRGVSDPDAATGRKT